MKDELKQQRKGSAPRRLALLCFLVLAGAIVAHVSLTMHPRFLTMGDSIASQQAIFDRTNAVFGGQTDNIHNWRNRVMLPYLLEGVSRATGMSFGRAYVLSRWVTATVALAMFMWLAMRTLALDAVSAAAAAVLFAFSLISTFTHIYEIPSDFLDAAFFCALTVWALEGLRGAFLVTMLLALLNRESAVFGVIVWFFVQAFGGGTRRFVRETLWCALGGALSTAVVVGLRVLNSGHQGATLGQGLQTFEPAYFLSLNMEALRGFLSRPHFGNPFFLLGAYLAALGLLLRAEWGAIGTRARQLAVAATAIFLASCISNCIDELRMFIPSLVLMMLVVASVVWRRQVGGSGGGPGA
jgi:hypothetical protein